MPLRSIRDRGGPILSQGGGVLMRWLLGRIARSSRTLTLALAFLVMPTTVVQAQFFGYGYGMPGYGYGYPGYGFGGLGYPGIGYGYGFGYPGYAYGAGFYSGGPGLS